MLDRDGMFGECVLLSDLKLPRSIELAAFLHDEVNPYARLLEVRSLPANGSETIIFAVDVDASQLTVNDIRSREVMGVTFLPADDDWPEVLALREDFPKVLHCNLRPFEVPRSLCLYENRFLDARSGWPTVAIVERVREWLRDTASGTLHQPDQPLEQLFLVTPNRIILPSALEDVRDFSTHHLHMQYADRRPWGELLICREMPQTQGPNGAYLTFHVVTSPLASGPIRREPQSVGDLRRLVEDAGGDFVGFLRAVIAALPNPSAHIHKIPILLVTFPKTRTVETEPESFERWAFWVDGTLGSLGEAVGLWQQSSGSVGMLLNAEANPEACDQLAVTILNPVYWITPIVAAAMNSHAPDERRICAIGMGALGSQTVALMARSGIGRWTLVDGDVILPHNLVRHIGTANSVGLTKVDAVGQILNAIFETAKVDTVLFHDVLREGPRKSDFEAACTASDLILDFSASVAVQRALVSEGVANRKMSCFLNPAGDSLVILAEDTSRSIRLDSLEMQYYRLLIRDPGLRNHLPGDSTSIRFARSCGDKTGRIPTAHVGIFAGLAAKFIDQQSSNPQGSITVWSLKDDGSVMVSQAVPIAPKQVDMNSWTICFDEEIAQKLQKLRLEATPRETGGVLLGVWDFDTRNVYVVECLGAPPDSDETENNFVRGTEGLSLEVQNAVSKTGNIVQYVGEWHSHPDGYSTAPSIDDLLLLKWLATNTQTAGIEPLMAIVGKDGISWLSARIS